MRFDRTSLLAVAGILLTPAFALAREVEAAGSGLPPSVNEGLITALVALVVFLFLIGILGKTAWGPIATALAAREKKIRDDIDIAERARRDAEAALANYKAQIANADVEVRAKLAAAQKDAEAIGARLKADAQREIEEMKSSAGREIEETKNAALVEVRQQAASLSTAVASRILKRNINEADQADLIRSSLEELQVAGRQ